MEGCKEGFAAAVPAAFEEAAWEGFVPAGLGVVFTAVEVSAGKL